MREGRKGALLRLEAALWEGLARVDGLVGPADLEMQVGARGEAGGAHAGYRLPGPHVVPLADLELRVVGVEGGRPLVVAEYDRVALSTQGVPGVEDLSRGGGVDGLPLLGGEEEGGPGGHQVGSINGLWGAVIFRRRLLGQYSPPA